MEKIQANNHLKKETQERHTTLERLQATEGFSKLTSRQQRIITQSLYIQDRAERLSDPASAEAVVSRRNGYNIDSTRIHNEDYLRAMHDRYTDNEEEFVDDRQYRRSQNHIVNWYCHGAIQNLEEERGLSDTPESIREGFFQADYHHIKNLEELTHILESFGFPAVIHISDNPENSNDSFFHQHTALALGHDASGDIVIWEKEGYQLPYKVTTLAAVYAHYMRAHFWGVRHLETKVTQ